MVDLEAITASFQGRLKKLIPPDAERWCLVECLVEFGKSSTARAECILKVARLSATYLIVLSVRSVYGKPGLVTQRASTTAQIVESPVLTVRG